MNIDHNFLIDALPLIWSGTEVMNKYLIVLEKSETGFSAYSPDVWGCVATGESSEQTLENMRSALILQWSNNLCGRRHGRSR